MSTFINRNILILISFFPKVDTFGDFHFFSSEDKDARDGTTPATRFFKMKMKSSLGFSLLELLISFTVVVILLLGAAQLTLHSLHAKRLSDCSLESAEMASEKLEYLKSLPFESQELEPCANAERIKSQKKNDIFIREWIVIDVTSNMKRIEVTCYSESCANRKARLALLYSKELGF